MIRQAQAKAAKCTETLECDFCSFLCVWAFCFCFGRLQIWLFGGMNIIVLFWREVLDGGSFPKINLGIKIWCL